MSLPFYHVDAFTDRPFAGNPAAVCLLPSWRQDRWLQAVASRDEPLRDRVPGQAARSFRPALVTPGVEVDLCGHATLASAHILGNRPGHRR